MLSRYPATEYIKLGEDVIAWNVPEELFWSKCREKFLADSKEAAQKTGIPELGSLTPPQPSKSVCEKPFYSGLMRCTIRLIIAMRIIHSLLRGRVS